MTIIEISNGFRAWGVAGVLMTLPVVSAFLRFAWTRAMENCAHVAGHWTCAVAFVRGAWAAGYDAPLRINTWVPVILLGFVGVAGSAIFVSSNMGGGYDAPALNVVMLFGWLSLSSAAWSVTVATATAPLRMALAAILLMVIMQAASLSLVATT